MNNKDYIVVKMWSSPQVACGQRLLYDTHRVIPRLCGQMFEFERYVHSVNDRVLLAAYLDRVAMRIKFLKAVHGIDTL